MNDIVLRNVKNASTAGVTIATLLAIYGFKEGVELNIIHLSVAWACSVVSLRYFLRASYTFNDLRNKCFEFKNNEFLAIIFLSHGMLVFFSCINSAMLNNLSIKFVIIVFTLQSCLIVLQWMVAFTTIFSKDFRRKLDNDNLERKYITAHSITLAIDIGTAVLSGYFIAIVFTTANVDIFDTLLIGTLLFIVVVIEGAIHWWIEKEWSTNPNNLKAT